MSNLRVDQMTFETDYSPSPDELEALTNNLVSFNFGRIEVDRRIPLLPP